MNENQNLKVLAIDTETGKLCGTNFVSPVVEFLVNDKMPAVLSHTSYGKIDLSKYPQVVCRNQNDSVRMVVSYHKDTDDGDCLVFNFGEFVLKLYPDDSCVWK